MQADGKRLGTGGKAGVERCRNLVDLLDRQRHFIAKKPLHMREAHGAAEEPHVEALVALIPQAEVAMPARHAGIDRHLITRRHAGNPAACLHDAPGNLMAEDHRFLQPDRSEPGMVIIVQVGAADAAPGDLHPNFAWSRPCCGRPLLDAKVMGLMSDDSAHDGFSWF